MEVNMIDLLKQLVDEECINSAVYRAVNEKFNYYVEQSIEKLTKELITDKANTYIYEKIEEVFAGKVRVDNGWGSAKTYDTFEDYVRISINNGLKNNWELERVVRKTVDAKLQKYINKVCETKINVKADEVLELIAEDLKKENE